MEINIVPVMVKDDGNVAVHIAPTADPLKPGYIKFSSDNLPDHDEVISHLPEDFLAENKTEFIVIKTMPQSNSDKVYITVSGKEDAFAPPRTDQNSRWVSQSDIKYGPLPQNVKDSSKLQGLYTESMERPDLGALYGGIFNAKSLGITEEIPNNLPAICERLSQSPELSSVFIQYPGDNLRAMLRPLLDWGATAAEAATDTFQPMAEKALKVRITRRMFTQTAMKLVAFARNVGTFAPDLLAARSRAKIVAAAASGGDPVPKPA